MNAGLSVVFRDVQSPIRASNRSTNWIVLSFFRHIIYRNQLPEALGRK